MSQFRLKMVDQKSLHSGRKRFVLPPVSGAFERDGRFMIVRYGRRTSGIDQEPQRSLQPGAYAIEIFDEVFVAQECGVGAPPVHVIRLEPGQVVNRRPSGIIDVAVAGQPSEAGARPLAREGAAR